MSHPFPAQVLDGYNVCIFAYGQTGSGKTYTMTGPPEDRGCNMRALTELFAKSETRKADVADAITVSVIEVYNEQIRDLLSSSVGAKKLEVRRGDKGNYVPDLTEVAVHGDDRGRKRVIQRRFDAGVLEAIPTRKASALCVRPER